MAVSCMRVDLNDKKNSLKTQRKGFKITFTLFANKIQTELTEEISEFKDSLFKKDSIY